MEECRPVLTPMDTQQQLSKADRPNSEEEGTYMESVPYRRLVGKLMYLAQATRPDLSFAVSKLSQFASNPGKVHWAASKQVLRYLQRTKGYAFKIDKCGEEVIAHSDSDWAGCKDDRRSISGFLIQFGSTPIVCKSNKQTCDNQAAVNFAKGNSVNSHSQHIDIRLHFLRDMVENEILRIEYLPTNENIADLFTKPLSRIKNDQILERICVEKEEDKN